MSKKVIIICAVLMFFPLFVNVALSEMEYPQELKKILAPYPDADVVHTVKASGTVMVMMQSGGSLDPIFEFYKKELAANGWTISLEAKQEGNLSLIGEKGSNTVAINIGSDPSGKSMIMLTLAPKD